MRETDNVPGFSRAPFTYESVASRVVFGEGTAARVSEEADRLGIHRALVITSPVQKDEAARLRGYLGDRCRKQFTDATMHTPWRVTERALQVVRDSDIDGIIALGGGSAVGLSKALSLRTKLPQLVLPTTYAGSEMTPILGETRDGVKTTQRSREILPNTVIYDVDLTLGLPVAMSASSGMNAIAHAVEALYAPENNPIITMMAEAGIGALAQALPQLMHSAADKAARTEALYGAWLCGTCLGSVSMSLHHKLCHVLGGSFDLPHAETHAIILPHATAYNAGAAPKAMAHIARALGCNDAAQGLHDLLLRLGIPNSLRQIGMPEDGIEAAANLVMQAAYANPRTVELGSVRHLIARAYRGNAPAP